MDRFGYSLLPAATEAGLGITALSRHVPLFRRSVGRDETTLAVASAGGGLLVLLTGAHLVMTRETRPLHRIRFHLHAKLDELSDASWRTEPDAGRLLLRFRLTGTAHEYRLRPGFPRGPGALATAFDRAFTPASDTSRPTVGHRMPQQGAGPDRLTLASMLSVQPSWQHHPVADASHPDRQSHRFHLPHLR